MRVRGVGEAKLRLGGFVLLGVSLAGVACQDFRECPNPGDALGALPERLSETGLYEDIGRESLAPGVMAFTPNFALWSDGAEKRRFIALPEGARIDSSDMDDWQFPVGTRLWKEFTRDGVRVETRLEQKIGPEPSAWALQAYVWNEDDDEALRAPGGVANARGTEHDVPRAADCVGCHGGRKSGVLGFSAIQLARTPADQRVGELDLSALIARDLLSVAPIEPPRVPGEAKQVAGLGYLHANCGHCHNRSRPESDGPRCYDPQHRFEFVLRVNQLSSVKTTATYRTALDDVILPGNSAGSEVVQRMRVRNPDLPSMPPLATSRVDAAGVASVRAFIDSL